MTTPPFSAAQEAARTAAVRQYDIIDCRCTHPSHKGDALAYRLAGKCSNCGAGPLVGLFTSGHEKSEGRCPACGNRTVRFSGLADENPETAL